MDAADHRDHRVGHRCISLPTEALTAAHTWPRRWLGTRLEPGADDRGTSSGAGMRVPIAVARALAAVAVVAVGLLGTAGSAVAAPAVPYTDPSAVGYIGLCNQQGQQITSGSVSTLPFVSRAVSSVPADSSISGTGRTATLYAFQPIDGIDPEDWSGEQLTGTAQYSNPSHPMTAATTRDSSLASFVDTYPPVWDGFIELRIILDAPGKPAYVQTYPALNIHVSGDTWQAVGGGSVNCNAGQATSDEDILPKSTGSSGSSSSSSSGSHSASGSSATGGGTKGSVDGKSTPTGSGSGNHADSGTGTITQLSSRSSSNTALVVIVSVLVVAVAIAIAFAIRRRRKALQ
jgi:hypothetical protein